MKTHFYAVLVISGSFLGNGVLAQESTNATGGNASGSGGSVSYSVGQVAFNAQTGSNGLINQGVQQPIEFYSLNTIEQDLAFGVKIFPNPVVSELTVKFPVESPEGLSMILTDLNGKVVFEQNIGSSSEKIDMSQMASSSYYLNFFKSGKVIGSYQVVKNN